MVCILTVMPGCCLLNWLTSACMVWPSGPPRPVRKLSVVELRLLLAKTAGTPGKLVSAAPAAIPAAVLAPALSTSRRVMEACAIVLAEWLMEALLNNLDRKRRGIERGDRAPSSGACLGRPHTPRPFVHHLLSGVSTARR